jgi:ATP-dependent protease ClpP protease subunit
MLFLGVLFSLNMIFAQQSNSSVATAEKLRKIISPTIQNDTLVIEGRISSHIYDYLAYETEKVKKVRWVSVNSFGGDHNWALAIAEKLREFGVNTRLNSGNVCASACVYIFAAGQERIMESGTWLGIHGARMGAGYMVQFQTVCSQLTSGKTLIVITQECSDFLKGWYDVSWQATQKAFSFLESMGVSSQLLVVYMSLEDVPNWAEHMNVLKKPDWVVTADVALKFNLATHIEKKVFSQLE